MELKLNVYKNGKVAKTYTAEDYTLTTGICEDLLEAVDIDKISNNGLSNEAIGVEIIKGVAKSFKKFKPFLQDVFAGLTDEEYRNTSVKEVALVITEIVQYTISGLVDAGKSQKN